MSRVAAGIVAMLMLLFSAGGVNAQSVPTPAVPQSLTFLAYGIPFFLETQTTGALVHLMHAIGHRAGMTITLDVQPASRANQAYLQGNSDGLMPVLVSRLPAFSGTYGAVLPFFLKREFAFVRQGQTPPATFSQMHGKRVGVTTGYAYGGLREQHGLLLEEAASDTANMRKLAAGRIDVFVCEEISALALVRDLGLENIIYNPASPLAEMEAVLILRPRYGLETVVIILQEALNSMLRDGSYHRLFLNSIPRSQALATEHPPFWVTSPRP